MPAVNIAVVDDHILLRNGLANFINTFGEFNVLFESSNGKDFIQRIDETMLPDIVLMDINMPEMDGYETCLWLKQKYPSVKVLALSMYDNESAIIRMFKSGAKGYILKDSEPAELRAALHSLATKGFYYSEMVTGKLIRSVNEANEDTSVHQSNLKLSDREIAFLKYACTELTYKEIAEKMFVSPRTIDNYRDGLFVKLDVKTRVGLVMYAIRNGMVRV